MGRRVVWGWGEVCCGGRGWVFQNWPWLRDAVDVLGYDSGPWVWFDSFLTEGTCPGGYVEGVNWPWVEGGVRKGPFEVYS